MLRSQQQHVPGDREVPSNNTPPRPAEISPRSASPFIPPAAINAHMPPSQRAIYLQAYTPYGGHYGPNPHVNPTQRRNENDPYVAVDPFKPSIMQNHRKHAARPHNTTYGAVPPIMGYGQSNYHSNYHHYPSYPYPSNRYPGQHVSAQPPLAPDPPFVPAPSETSERSNSRHHSTLPSSRRDYRRSYSRSRERSRSRSRSGSRGRSGSRSPRRCHGGESDHAPPSHKDDSNSRRRVSPLKCYYYTINRDNTVQVEPIAIIPQENVDLEGEPIVTSSEKSARPSQSTDHIAEEREHPWTPWYPDPNVRPSITSPLPETKEYSAHGDSESGMLVQDQVVATRTLIFTVLFDLIPRQLYLHFLLRIPYLYFSRVTRIFEETELSMAEIRRQTLENKGNPFGYFPGDKIGLVRTWESFIDSLLREWKTLNIVSVLMLSAILTILQIDVAASDPIIRYSALLSMICALMSLLYGCMYIIRFGSMKKAHKAAEWAEEAQSTTTNIFWNVWVLLAMPATWLAWSIILYVTCIAAFIWRTSPGEDPGNIPISNPLWPRIVLSAILGLGLVYLVLIIATLRRYGDAMDQAWRMRVENWAQSWQYPAPQNDYLYSRTPYNPYDESGKRGFGATSMPPVINREPSPELSSNSGKSCERGQDSQYNSQRNSVVTGDLQKSRSSRGPSPTRTLQPVIIQIPNSSGEAIEHPRPIWMRGSPSERADVVGDTGLSADVQSFYNNSGPAVEHEAGKGLNTSDQDRGPVDIYEISFSGETQTYDLLWKHSSDLAQAGAIKVYDLNSDLEECLISEEQFINYQDDIPSKEAFDNLVKDLRSCTRYGNGEQKRLRETDIEHVINVLRLFNAEVCSDLHFKLILCYDYSVGASSKSVYLVSTTTEKVTHQDIPT